MEKRQLLSMTCEELESFVTGELGESRFRARQISEWLVRGADVDGMTNLSAKLRQRLGELAVANPIRILESYRSKIDDTEKFLYALDDGNLIEGVVMRYHYGDTLCVSTQVGCRMGCAFCASTLNGCVRSLSAAEMLGQVHCANRLIADDHISNIVLMGSGEPLDNYDNVTRFLRLVSHPDGLNIGLRHISLSTCGLVPQMKRFAREGLPVTLSLSLHAPNDTIRRQLMPVANAFAMEDVLDACRYYIEQTGRRVIFEYALVDQLNSRPEHAAELAQRLRGMQCHVNVIPLNSVEEKALRGADEAAIERFMQELERRHISVTRRREMGDDIDGACGQLRRHYLADQAERQE